jgi:hypothetical protein
MEKCDKRQSEIEASMIVARIQDGRIEAYDPIPPEWEGRIVTISPSDADDRDFDLIAALAEFEALGPTEFEEGESEEMEKLLKDMDQASQVGFKEPNP